MPFQNHVLFLYSSIGGLHKLLEKEFGFRATRRFETGGEIMRVRLQNAITNCVVGICLALAAIPSYSAESYPLKPVRIIVGFSPGGGTDLLARLVASKLGDQLKQSFLVENRVGASGNIAGQLVASAKPDGYTLLWIPTAHAVNAALGKDVGYDPIGAFAPVTLVMANSTLINVGPAVPVSSVKELIALAKVQPGKLSFATSGTASSSHISAELFRMMAGIQLLHVPYKGGGDATRAVMTGEVTLSFNDIQASVPLVRSGKLKAIAVTGRKRAAILPDVPTAAESGLPGYEYSVWFGLLAPRRTPPEVVQFLRNEIVAILKQPDLVQRFEADGGEVVGSTPDEFGRFLAVEVDKWRKVVKAAGIE